MKMGTKTRGELLQDLVDTLMGTFKKLEEGVSEVFEVEIEEAKTLLTEEDHEWLDNEIFCCDTCEWWFELGDSGDSEGNCLDCNNEIDEEE